MDPSIYSEGVVDREEDMRQYGRFRALELGDQEELEKHYRAEAVAEKIISEFDQNIEKALREEGHIPREEEMQSEKFRELHQRVRNIRKEWSAAIDNKNYEELETSDLVTLEDLLEQFRDALKYEAKVTDYLDIFRNQLENLDLDEEKISEYLGEENVSGVGQHLDRVEKKQAIDLEEMKAKVEREIDDTREEFESEISEFQEQVQIYREHLEIFEAVFRELTEVEIQNDDEEVKQKAENLQQIIEECMELTVQLIDRKQEVVENHQKAKNLRKNVARFFL